MHLFTCQPHYEHFLTRELVLRGLTAVEQGPGWVAAEDGLKPPETVYMPGDLCFAHAALGSIVEVKAANAHATASGLVDLFMQSARTERFEGPWPLLFEHAAVDGLARRTATVEAAWQESMRKRMSRVSKLAATPSRSLEQPARGFFAYVVDFGRAFGSRTRVDYGQCRMKDDPAAPSRSFLKVEESYTVLGTPPGPNDRIVDLGAAPGGWSYSAAQRGAYVIAVDNGPLKGAALNHPLIEHRQKDAFSFCPTEARSRTWLFCDMVEDPYRVLDLLTQWVTGRWCTRFIVNLKFGKTDPIALLARINDPNRDLAPRCSLLRVRHLYHDREELTVVGNVTPR